MRTYVEICAGSAAVALWERLRAAPVPLERAEWLTISRPARGQIAMWGAR